MHMMFLINNFECILTCIKCFENYFIIYKSLIFVIFFKNTTKKNNNLKMLRAVFLFCIIGFISSHPLEGNLFEGDIAGVDENVSLLNSKENKKYFLNFHRLSKVLHK
jgi:hypothetical protein